ncbi:UPF0149 family protein [Lysobacter sp. GX 14042]|uniref:UPF0149 family protein n=1 Tax=Lysobacter sp. GX 14042 TaxID=2907155 RepID=UPI0031BAA0E4
MAHDPTPELPGLADVQAALDALQAGASAPEVHGGLCGWLAGGGAAVPEWPARVLADANLPTPEPGSVLDRLRVASQAQLEDRGFDFSLLLPDAGEPLVERSGALFDWCRGMLGGFGLAAGANPPLSEEAVEALGDLGKLAQAQAQEEGDEEDEQALAEIEEYIRVATLLLHGDCVLAVRHRKSLN